MCILIGDPRVTQTPMLTVLHSLTLRLHNEVASQLASLNSHWRDERIFQEARRISIAFYQHIVYEEWLVLIFGMTNQSLTYLSIIHFLFSLLYIGKGTAYKLGLACGKNAKSCGNYNPNTDPGTINENSQAAFRLFHLFVPYNFRLINEGKKSINFVL